MRGKVALCISWMLGMALAASHAWAADEMVLRAMRDELARSLQQLQLAQLDKPYFIAYRVNEFSGTTASGAFGGLLNSGSSHSRFLSVEVRVGDYAFDNTNFLSTPSFGNISMIGGMFAGTAQLPLEDDYLSIRRQIWLATDAAYKKAVEDISKKRAALENKTRTEDLPDFSRVEVTHVTDTGTPPVLSRTEAEAMVRELSGLFRGMPDVDASTVNLHAGFTHSLYINSEGTTFVQNVPLVTLIATAETQAPDGMPLADSLVLYGRSMADLPPTAELASRIHALGASLAQLRKAPPLDRYNGPVLLEGQAATEVFQQVFAARLLATRHLITDLPQYETMLAQFDNPFLDRVGSRVLPTFLSVIDHPGLAELAHTCLLGGTKVDDDGVPTRETPLIVKGQLKTLLSTRTPVRGVSQSTGSRHGTGPRPSNLIVTSENGKSDQEMRQELLRLAQERGSNFAIVVTKIRNPASTRDPMQLLSGSFGGVSREAGEVRNVSLAYKLFPDGHEELIRNAAISDLTIEAFKNIVAASLSVTVETEPFATRSVPFSLPSGIGSGGASPVSVAAPSLLFEELTLKKPAGEIPKLPVAKHPYFDR